jgi:ATP-dependent Zn protease
MITIYRSIIAVALATIAFLSLSASSSNSMAVTFNAPNGIVAQGASNNSTPTLVAPGASGDLGSTITGSTITGSTITGSSIKDSGGSFFTNSAPLTTTQEVWAAAKQPTLMMVLVVLGLILAIYFLRRHLKNNQARQEARERSSLGRSDDDYYGEEMHNRRSSDRQPDSRYDSDYRNDFNSTTGGGNTKNPATLILPNAPGKNTFADVAGQPEAISRLREVCEWLKEPEVYNRHDAQLPRGILLVGPPGTGKTLLARALAGEADASMFHTTGSSFVEMYVGVGASRVRALFEDARRQRQRTQKPVLIFIDEIDAVGGARGNGTSSNSEREQTLNQLLTEMDGFKENEGIIVLAATNRSDMLDAALKRKGRFDLEVFVDLPDVSGREAIFKVHSRKKKLDGNVDFALIARRTFGFSGADIEAACNEAAVIAARKQSGLDKKAKAEAAAKAEAEAQATGTSQILIPPSSPAGSGPGNYSPGNSGFGGKGSGNGKSQQNHNQQPVALPEVVKVTGPVTLITTEMLDEAISIVEAGEARKDRLQAMTLEDKQQTAFHELGHAVVTLVLKGDPITKITILPRGRALGYVQTHTEADRWNMTKEQMLKRITSAMAGRIAQEIFMNTIDTGASSDFQQANNMAKLMVTQFGMSKLGRLYLENNQTPIAMQVGPRLADAIDSEVQAIVQQCEEQARELLTKYESPIRALSGVLIEKETLLGPDLLARWEALTTTAAPTNQE